MNLNKRFVGHIPVRVNDINTTRDFYMKTLGLRHSGTTGLKEDAINVITRDALCFMSCGDMHHDFAGFQGHDKNWKVRAVTPDDLHHVSFTLRPHVSLQDFKAHLDKLGVQYTPGAAMPDPTETYTAGNSLHFRDPNGHFIEIHSAEVDADAR
jgi:catechol 2,3-dioxygenase-like lactoylglutathione lyase family enzyme